MKLFILRWGIGHKRIAIYQRLDQLIQHHRENVRNHPENRRLRNGILSVRERGADSTRLDEGEVQLLLEAGLLRKAETA